jgi:outer membrane immunogenic protein
MRARVITAALISCAMISVAAASDLPTRVATKAPTSFSPAPLFTWTGWYAGLTAGYGWGNASFSEVNDNDVDPLSPETGSTFRTRGANIGSTLGYNMQSGAVVYGLETDLNVNWLRGTTSAADPCVSCEVRNPWFGTFRGRLGYAPDMNMYYVTGGLAYGGVRVQDTFGNDERHNKAGWTLGAGVEHAFNNRWSAKVEYLYVDLGNTGFGGGFGGGLNTRFNENIVRVGLNAHF